MAGRDWLLRRGVCNDVVNRFREKAYEADGFIFGSPVHYAGASAEQVKQDEEGLYTMRVLARNMAYLLRCQEAARNAGVELPEQEPPIFTYFVR